MNVRHEIEELLKITGVSCEFDLSSIVEATQEAWLVPGDSWSVEEKYDEKTRAEIFQLFTSLGYTQKLNPQRKKYDYCCIHGGLMPVMAARFAFVAELEKNGVELGELVFLTGDRALSSDDKLQEFPNIPQGINESSGMMFLYNTLDFLVTLRKRPITFVDAPQVRASSGLLTRPSTCHTIREWLRHYDPEPGSCLFISNQPFYAYQSKVAEAEMPPSFTIETVGPAISDEDGERSYVLLDTLARALYQEKQNREAGLVS